MIAASDAVAAVAERLRTTLSKGRAYVRVVAAPSPEVAEYNAAEGLDITIGAPQPREGGGRYNTLVRRGISVQVTTQSTLDVAGSDETAVMRHCDLEDAVINALRDLHPTHPAPAPGRNGEYAVQCLWVPGGGEPVRRVGRDTGTLRSVLAFVISYGQEYST